MANHWIFKCAVDNAKGLIPFQRPLRGLKDRILGYRRYPKRDSGAIEEGLLLMEWLGDVAGARVIEIGTGWQPLIPILLRLAGARLVYLTDSNPLLRHDTFSATLESLRENRKNILRRLKLNPDVFDHATRPFTNLGAVSASSVWNTWRPAIAENSPSTRPPPMSSTRGRSSNMCRRPSSPASSSRPAASCGLPAA